MDLRARARAPGGLRFYRHTEPHRLEERGKKMEVMEMEKMKREEKSPFQQMQSVLKSRQRREKRRETRRETRRIGVK